MGKTLKFKLGKESPFEGVCGVHGYSEATFDAVSQRRIFGLCWKYNYVISNYGWHLDKQ